MGTRKTLLRAIVPVATLALVLAGCAGKPGPKPDEDGRYPRSSTGDTYLEGQIELVEITPPPEGGAAEFVIRNTTTKDLEDVTASVRFYRDATGGGAQEFDVELQDYSVNVFAGSRATITATPMQEGEVKGWELRIEPLTTVADPTSGTEYLEGSLRCVAMAKDLTGDSPSVSFELENVSSGPVEPPQFRVIFRRGGSVIGSTDWQSAGNPIAPGDTTMLAPDLSGIDADLGGATAVLQLQQLIL